MNENMNNKPVNTSAEDHVHFWSVAATIFTYGCLIITFIDRLRDGKIDADLKFYLIVAVVTALVTLSGIVDSRFVHVLRGVGLILLLEAFIIHDIEEIHKYLSDFSQIKGIDDVQILIWLGSLGLFLIFEAVKSLVHIYSKGLTVFVVITGIVNVIATLFLLVIHYENVNPFDVYQFVNDNIRYFIFGFFLLANLGLSIGYQKTAKKKA